MKLLIPLVLLLTGCSHTLPRQWPLGTAWPEHFENPLSPPLDAEAARATSAATAYVAAKPSMQSALKGCPPGQALRSTTFKEGSIYVVEVEPNLDTCPDAYGFDWFEVYAVAPDGRLLAKRPRSTEQ